MNYVTMPLAHFKTVADLAYYFIGYYEFVKCITEMGDFFYLR